MCCKVFRSMQELPLCYLSVSKSICNLTRPTISIKQYSEINFFREFLLEDAQCVKSCKRCNLYDLIIQVIYHMALSITMDHCFKLKFWFLVLLNTIKELHVYCITTMFLIVFIEKMFPFIVDNYILVYVKQSVA